MSALLLFLYAFLGSLGLTLIKKSFNTFGLALDSIKSPVLLSGFGLYGFSFLLWLKILNENELSFAFPIASAALFICISLFSSYFLHEHLGFFRIFGMVLIITGILFASRG